MSELVNLGSFCIDYVYSVPSIVRAGETLLGTGPVRHAGGKGLNQSLAAARAGARVAPVGRVGVD
jgi:ribokinase